MQSDAGVDQAQSTGAHSADGSRLPHLEPAELESLLPLVTHTSANSTEDDSSFTESSSRQPESGRSETASDRQVWLWLYPLHLLPFLVEITVYTAGSPFTLHT